MFRKLTKKLTPGASPPNTKAKEPKPSTVIKTFKVASTSNVSKPAVHAPSRTEIIKTAIIGASGCVGTATLESLMLRKRGNMEVYAGVRDEERFRNLMIGVPTIKTDMNNRKEMRKALEGFQRVFIVTPCDENRTGLVTNALEAAKAAGVEFILVLSVTIAQEPDTIFGRQFGSIEDKTRRLGIPYTIIRLPIFMDNIFAYAGTVCKEDKICDPRDPIKKYATVAVDDVGKCAAEILINPKLHDKETYNLISQKYSMKDLIRSMSTILKRKIRVKEITYKRFKEAMRQSEVPEWQVEGLSQWLKSDIDDSFGKKDLANIKLITGEGPSNIDFFIAMNAQHFGWSPAEPKQKRHL